MTRDELKRCETARDVEACSGQRVIIAGTYHRMDLRMRKAVSLENARYAAIRLGDGVDVLLEASWSPTAVRSPEELARHDGKSVEVIGVVQREMPPPDEPVAYVIGPCVSPVETIRLSAPEVSR